MKRLEGKVIAGLFCSLLALSPALSLAGDLANGERIYTTTCTVCHGESAQGSKQFNAPSLYQQEDWYIVAQLKKFRDGLRGTDPTDLTGVLMRPMALTLTDDQAIDDVVAYIVSLTGPPPTQDITGDLAAGKLTYETVCTACHGPEAQGNDQIKSPALAGQHDWYLLDQLKKFKAGHRGGDPRDLTGMQMKAIVIMLPDERAMRNVVAFLGSIEKERRLAATGGE